MITDEYELQPKKKMSMAEYAEIELDELCKLHDEMLDAGLLDDESAKDGIPCT